MKQSIKKIFLNLNTYLFFILFASFVGVTMTFEHQLSFNKVDNLNSQKEIINSLTKLDKDDVELALIQFNGKSTELYQKIDNLKSLYKYNYSDRFIFNNSKEYLSDLNKLKDTTDKFNNIAHIYYANKKDDDTKKIQKSNLDNAFVEITNRINHILLENITYDKVKFEYIKIGVLFTFAIILLSTILYRKKLFAIYKDIEYLYHIDKSKMSYEIYSIEADAISLRMSKKTVVNDNPTMVDPITAINNYKGMISSYSNKKNLRDSNFTSLTILEIDDFSKSKRTFSQELTQAILKKIAYTISLHELPVDVIARTDYNQFTLIFSRASKGQSFKDIDLIRESIEELKFNIPDRTAKNVTVSGGFIIKPNNTNIEEAIKQAKEILAYAKSTGINQIMQKRDLAERDM